MFPKAIVSSAMIAIASASFAFSQTAPAPLRPDPFQTTVPDSPQLDPNGSKYTPSSPTPYRAEDPARYPLASPQAQYPTKASPQAPYPGASAPTQYPATKYSKYPVVEVCQYPTEVYTQYPQATYVLPGAAPSWTGTYTQYPYTLPYTGYSNSGVWVGGVGAPYGGVYPYSYVTPFHGRGHYKYKGRIW